ncbi:uncharacterized protein A1O5_02128 [Cladophialophora psammophila CBS 110553]|uniref:Major facilitator superfamily (MFS) profile domain-containing protein n=1 Tax=Cladophialophora psammophila CBS 110553 TaxID=1182543 RepID=W9X4K7_9EURO|nr:uncharacterized protein A1O5_02128 [Cladophialophora psammophila CBS 110553]EXJ75432.1 hypothetical protein A1O5_02128 [Cladophialophora psammophila CBS 110553]
MTSKEETPAYVHDDYTGSSELDAKETQTQENEKHDIGDLDVTNRKAFKSDESDGKVQWTPRTVLAFISLAGLNAGSQLVLYFVGGCLSYIAADLEVGQEVAWLPVANILGVAAVAPFTGYLEDLLGRRIIAIVGASLLCIGCLILGTAHHFGQALCGLSIAGAGAAVGELTALAGTSDIVPVKHRGLAVAAVTAIIIPFCPSVMYAQLFASHDTWRWSAWIPLIYNGMVVIGLSLTYYPKTHPRTQGMTTSSILKRVDYLGGALSIIGVTLFLVALQSGGFTHPWKSAYVLCTLLIGIALIVAFVLWEWKGAKYPMVPRELFAGQRVVALAYSIAFIGGMSFYSLLNFYPLLYSTIYNPAPIKVGVKALGVSLCTTFGAIVGNLLLSTSRGRAREILLVASIIMTAFDGAIAIATPFNANTTVTVGSLAGIGVGGILVPAATVAMIVVPDSLLATAVSLSLSVRTVGGSIGYSVYYNVFANKLKAKLPTYVAEYAIEAGLPNKEAEIFVITFLTAPAQASKISGVTAKVLEAAALGSRWAYAESLQYVWYTSIAFGSVAIILCLFLPSIKKYGTNRIAAEL